MLIQFSVKNFLSIKDRITFSMEPTNTTENEENIAYINNKKYLKIAFFYGANASGKTNIIKAIDFMRNYVLHSQNLQINQRVPLIPFKFDENTSNEPSEFDVIFIKDNIKYQYGFSATAFEVCDEYLYYYPNNYPSLIFERNGDNYKFNRKEENKLEPIKEKNTKNKLFLSTATNWNYEKTKPVFEWFINDLYVSFGTELDENYTIEMLKKENNNEMKIFFYNLMRQADINIDSLDFKIRNIEYEEFINNPIIMKMLPSNFKPIKDSFSAAEYKVKTIHNIKNKNYELNLDEESFGTIKMFGLAGILYKTLKNGTILFIDEIDRSTHPLLVKYILDLFLDNEINKNNAQLIFNSHDTNLLDLDVFRRDQIWFVEKDKEMGFTKIKPLTDFKARKKENIEKGYLLGRYGGVPFIDRSDNIWEEYQNM